MRCFTFLDHSTYDNYGFLTNGNYTHAAVTFSPRPTVTVADGYDLDTSFTAASFGEGEHTDKTMAIFTSVYNS